MEKKGQEVLNNFFEKNYRVIMKERSANITSKTIPVMIYVKAGGGSAV
jgi:hypothetical protein